MQYNSSKIAFSFLCLLSVAQNIQAAIIIKGDEAAATGQTFSFPVQQYASSNLGDSFYVGALGGSAIGKFALAVLNRGQDAFAPLGVERVKLNNVPGEPNPLFNSHIALLGLMSGTEGEGPGAIRNENPITVIESQLSSLYVIDTFFGFNPISVLSVPAVNDANGLTTGRIVGVGNLSYIFGLAAVTPNGDIGFGAPGSGIAFVTITKREEKNGAQITTIRELVQVDAGMTASTPGVIRSFPVDTTSDILKIGGNLAALNNLLPVNFYSDDQLKIAYAAFQATAGSGSNDGARALSFFYVTKDNKIASPIALPSAFVGENMIVGAQGAGAQVSIYQVKTMHTSTSLNYIIVLGGNGAPENVQNTVYALPIVNAINSTDHGRLANKNEIPSPFGIPRGFKMPALTPDQMTTSDDVPAQVGGGALAAGNIVDMIVRGDTVFASVANPFPNQLPGIFYSQAIFDSNGKIASWSLWKPVSGSDQGVYGFTFDSLGNFTSMVGGSETMTVQRTLWSSPDKDGLLGGTQDDGAVGLVSIMSSQLPQKIAGIQAFFDFPHTTPGLNDISLVIGTGLRKIVLAETGNASSGIFTPNFGNYAASLQEFNNGQITTTLPVSGTTPRVVVISGGVLNNIGPIVAAAITESDLDDSDVQGKLFVGGIGGLAVLINPETGDGWNAAQGLGPSFAGLTQGMQFVTVGSYSFVRKLIADNNFLYVLTDKQLDRIDLNADPSANTVTIALVQDLPGANINDTLIDLIVSGKFALLATSKGLYRVGNGADVSVAQSIAQVNWTSVTIPESVGPVIQLVPITQTGRSQDTASNFGSNVYALNAYVGKNLGQINRFVVKDVSATAIDDTTIVPMPDYFGHTLSYMVSFGGFRDIIALDGASTINAIDRNLAAEPMIHIILGLRNSTASYQLIPLNVTASRINGILRSSASGAWLIGGDFGLLVNE